MKILWINPSFLDYRVPVYHELDRLTNGGLKVIFSSSPERTPTRVVNKLVDAIGDNAIPLEGEKSYSIGKRGNFANNFLSVPWQPGLYKAVMGAPADVTIVEGFFQWSPLGYLRKALKGTPVVLSYERTAHTERASGYLRTAYRKLVSRAFVDSAIVNGELSKSYAESLGVNGDYIFTGGMSADSDFFRGTSRYIDKHFARSKFNLPSNKLVFLYVGQVIDRKGVLDLLKAWARFQGDAALVIAGDGDKLGEARSIIARLGLRNVSILGHVAYETLPALYKAADIFIIPTLEDNWSLVVPEAMACGLPIACSIYNGCWPELALDDVTGKVFDPLSTESVVSCLNYFCENKNSLGRLGEQAQIVEAEFSPKAAAAAIYCACQAALSKR